MRLNNEVFIQLLQAAASLGVFGYFQFRIRLPSYESVFSPVYFPYNNVHEHIYKDACFFVKRIQF
jgi:hypothetical protein